MKAILNNIKENLYNVFIMGNASNMQIVKVWALLAVPMLTLYVAVGHFPR
ncbi:hypothetical protein SAMN05216490_4247 [Mucilaginibacter mallensis]|uniref:Uncharacterized protein n=1 Tax=Mucilaginibacter mallensis TaxID=652787 RepID=A0A1H2BNV9_MUCMA|nr:MULTISPECIES: hypothetical protein [Mucilaginibacter]MBB6140006.1 hypothetical protein [Mucilaginibacter sp. X5P1]SDT59985.1 hypothetical protein SAMN05216490_4247 [Mucilaginibacter mallensis]